ncbi:MAG: family 78 glycoside hydrolase catalytic domain, partial [Candidatus Hydrogenedentota bacterium]
MMRVRMVVGVVIGLLAVFWTTGPAEALEGEETMTVGRLRCEYLKNPLGIDANPPRLSWIVESGHRGAKQTAYRILVASTSQNLANNKGDLWDSGKVSSSDSVLVPYAGKTLSSRQRCYWKVKVWDQTGNESAWSQPATWSMGLLESDDWQGDYIGMDAEQGNPEFPWLRKTFEISGKTTNARVYVNPLGYYELYINGERIDDAVLSPAVSQFNKRSFYLTHDVTSHLQQGPNTIALWMGRGWYAEGLPGVAYKGPLVRAQLEAETADGERITVATDASWKAQPSAFTRIGKWRSGHYGGERYDARAHNPAWAAPDFDARGWSNAVVVEPPEHTVSAQPVQTNAVLRRYEPAHLRFLSDNVWLVDFGTNLTGLFDITFTGLAPGQSVKMEYADRYTGGEFNTFSQVDEYLAKGGDAETFRNRFNYHAFRYVRITGVDVPSQTKEIAAYLVRPDFPVYGSFACSNPVLTNVHDMVHYTLECLSLGGYLVDCPHIERLGYGGDGQASTPTAMTMFGMGPLYKAWLADWRDCQRPDGGMPHTAPNPWHAGGGPYWCGFIIAASWEMYQDYGDARILETNYPAMQQWLGYVEEYTKDGLLREWPEVDYRNWYLGDWARPNRREKEAEKSVDHVNNCFVVQCYDWMAEIATVLERPEDAERYAQEADARRKRVHEAFYDPQRETYVDDTQLDLAYPLLVGMVPDGLREAVKKRLEEKILVEYNGHLDVGLVGVPLLTETLLQLDRNDLIFEYTNKETYPGWGYMLANGATTTWEHWDAHRSHIHNCYNGIGAWFYRGLAGIRPDTDAPGYAHFVLKPAVVGDVSWVSARQDTVRGVIESVWRVEDGRFVWDVRIPANTSATVMVPTSTPGAVTESDTPAAEAKSVKLVQGKDGRDVF